jgi:diguanylate cyclase (GGDEF)-like protein
VNKTTRFLEQRNFAFWVIASTVSIGLLGVIDFLTGYELSFSLFYLIPIGAVAWFGGRHLGWLMSVLAALTWLVAEILAGRQYSQPAIHLWNTMIRFGFFVIVTSLLTRLRSVHDVEWGHARTDYVSGAMNARHFIESLEMELMRARRTRQPLTPAYIDLDNFKSVNDLLGHDVGDEVIRSFVLALRSHLRATDAIARMGGDEFALLLPTAGQVEAELIIVRLHNDLTEQMGRNGWPVTFSVGVITCLTMPHSVHELIKAADELMYTVKNSSKNAVRFATYRQDPALKTSSSGVVKDHD